MPDKKQRALFETVARLLAPSWERTDQSIPLQDITQHMLQRLPQSKGVPTSVRRQMASRRRPEHKLAVLEAAYGQGNVTPHDGNFLIWDEQGREVIWADEKGISLKDLIDMTPVAMEVAGAIGGGAVGLATGAIPGMIAGGAAGGAGARALTEQAMAQGIPEEAERTVGEGLRDFGVDLAVNAIGEAVGPAYRAVRGARGAVSPGVAAAARRGIPTTAGERTGSRVLSGIEDTQGKLLGSGRRAKEFINDRTQRLVQLSDEIGVQLGRGSAPADKATANAMVKQLAGDMKLDYRDQLHFLEGHLQREMGANTLVEPAVTLGRLQEIGAAFQGSAEALGKRAHKSVMGILQDIQQAATGQGGKVSFEQLRTTRTLVNDAIRQASQDGAPVRDLKRLAGYLTEDMNVAVQRYGSEEADRAWRMVNEHISSWRSDGNPVNLAALAKVIGKDGDKLALNWAMADSGVEGSKRLAALRHGADPEEWGVISSSVWNDLGRTSGGEWVPSQFLRNVKKISPSNRRMLFGGPEYPGVIEAIDDLTSVLGMTKMSALAGNPSGTAPTLVNLILSGGVGAGAVTNPGIAAAAVGGITTNAIAARAFRNQAFLNTLATTTRVLRRSPMAKQAMIRRLVQSLANEPPEVHQWLLAVLGEQVEQEEGRR